MKTFRSILQLMLGDAAGRSLNFLALIYLARVLGVTEYGVLEFGLTLLAYLMVAGNFGVERWAVREVARGEEAPDVLRRALPARLLATLAALPLLLAAAWIPGFEGLPALMAVLGVGYLAGVADLRWVFAGQRRMTAVGTGLALGGLVFLGGVVATVRSADDLLVAGAWRTAGTLAMFGLWGALFLRHHGRPAAAPRPRPLTVLRKALPLAATHGLAMLSFNFDSLLIGVLMGAASVGLYSAAYRLAIIPLALGSAYFEGLYAHLSAARGDDSDAFATTVRRSLLLTWTLALGGGAVAIALAGPLLDLVFGPAYAGALPALRILVVSVVFSLLRGTWGWALNALNQSHLEMRSAAVATATNVLLNLALIPRYGLPGAATATAASEAVWLGLAWWFYRGRGRSAAGDGA